MPALSSVLRIGVLAAAAALPSFAQARNDKPVACKDAQGRVTIQLPPCPEVAPPPPPARPPPCQLNRADFDRAVVREDLFRTRFPDRVAHETAQRRDLAEIATRVRSSDARLRSLQVEHRRLMQELEFFRGRPLTAKLQADVDANVAQLEGLTLIFRQHEDEIARLQARFACERDTFGPLWNGAAPGSSGCRAGCGS